jgi:hypothetical protein
MITTEPWLISPLPDSRLQLGLHPGCHELLRSYSTLSQVFY